MNALLSQAYGCCILGDVAQARTLITQLRSAFAIENRPLQAAEIMLLEGVVALYSGDIDAGCDRLRRALAIGQHFPQTDLAQVASGWLAMAAFNEGDVLTAAALLKSATDMGVVASERARLRLATVAGNLCEYAAKPAAARSWNAASRRAALALGLSGALSSIIFNMAVLSIDASQLKRLTGTLQPEEGQNTLTLVQAAMGYDTGVGHGAQPKLHRLSLGMAYSICGRHDDALLTLRRYVADATGSRKGDAACGLVELALAEMGASPQPLSAGLFADVQAAGALLVEPLERAAWLCAMAEHHQRQGDTQAAQHHRQAMAEALAERAGLTAALAQVLEQGALLAPPTDWPS